MRRYCPIAGKRHLGRGVPAGTALLETLMAVAILTVAISLVAQFLATVQQQRTGLFYRQVALQTATNCLERLHAMPLEELRRMPASPAELAALAEEALPDGTVQVELTPVTSESQGLRIAVTIGWSDPAGRETAPVHLVAWRWNDAP